MGGRHGGKVHHPRGSFDQRGPRVRRVVKRLANPVTAGLVFNLVLLGTHAPPVIALQLESNLFHAFDHLLLIGTGLMMWMSLYSRSSLEVRCLSILRISRAHLREVSVTWVGVGSVPRRPRAFRAVRNRMRPAVLDRR